MLFNLLKKSSLLIARFGTSVQPREPRPGRREPRTGFVSRGSRCPRGGRGKLVVLDHAVAGHGRRSGVRGGASELARVVGRLNVLAGMTPRCSFNSSVDLFLTAGSASANRSWRLPIHCLDLVGVAQRGRVVELAVVVVGEALAARVTHLLDDAEVATRDRVSDVPQRRLFQALVAQDCPQDSIL
jgi:hypothetical protein